jgi:hypothetical protein
MVVHAGNLSTREWSRRTVSSKPASMGRPCFKKRREERVRWREKGGRGRN